MKKWCKIWITTLVLASFSLIKAQGQEVWKSLSEVSYKISEDQFGELYVPVFSDKIKKLRALL